MPTNHKLRSEKLLALIGQRLVYQQQQCEIIELLDGCVFVLQVLESNTNIQANQYGEGHRTVPVTYTVSVYDGEGELHPELVISGLEQLLGFN
jgi:hypothetical protein